MLCVYGVYGVHRYAREQKRANVCRLQSISIKIVVTSDSFHSQNLPHTCHTMFPHHFCFLPPPKCLFFLLSRFLSSTLVLACMTLCALLCCVYKTQYEWVRHHRKAHMHMDRNWAKNVMPVKKSTFFNSHSVRWNDSAARFNSSRERRSPTSAESSYASVPRNRFDLNMTEWYCTALFSVELQIVHAIYTVVWWWSFVIARLATCN